MAWLNFGANLCSMTCKQFWLELFLAPFHTLTLYTKVVLAPFHTLTLYTRVADQIIKDD